MTRPDVPAVADAILALGDRVTEAALTVACPWCGAPPGRACFSLLGAEVPAGHGSRITAAVRAGLEVGG